MRRAGAITLIALALAGCDQHAARVDERLTAIEQRLSRMETRQINEIGRAREEERLGRAGTMIPAPPRPATPPPARDTEAPAPRYELIGLAGGRRTYPSQSRCEAARAALRQGWAEEQERQRREQGAYTIYPAVNCVPL